MLDTKVSEFSWTCPPQVKDLPHETQIGITCRSCGAQWGESVQGLIARHMGAEFVDLLEWKYRCRDEACGGLVRVVINGHAPEMPQVQPHVSVLAGPRVPGPKRPLYPVKAVVKPRVAPPPVIPAAKRQLSLPLVPH